MQTEKISLLPENVAMIVKEKQDFIIHPENDFLFDLFQCKGQSKLTYSSTVKSLATAKLKSMEMMGMANQPHAVRINRYSDIFIRIEGNMSIVRWFPIN
jgi:hypothetical protein